MRIILERLDLILNARGDNARYRRRNGSSNAQSETLSAHQDELEITSERLGHTPTATTKKFDRSNVTNVAPLIRK